ncbi:MAG: HlyD family efflux transporter periplasmic adaptor subunit [Phascolarctobacterium sp.]
MQFTQLQQKPKLFLMALLAACVLAGGYYWYQKSHRTDDLTLYGNVDVRQISLAFNASERIESMLVEEGESVKKGQLLATLRTDTLKLNIAHSKAQIATQEAVVERLHNGSRPEEIIQAEAVQREAQADYENALLYKQRLQSLYEQHAVSKQQLDDANARFKAASGALDNARAAHKLAQIGPRYEEIKQAEAQLLGLKATLAIQEYNLEQSQLRAPQDGTIRSRLQEPGNMVTPQKSVYLITSKDKKWVRAYASEPQLGKVKPGMAAKVYIDSYPDKPITGSVGYISDTAEFTPKTVQTPELRTSLLYEVRIYVEDQENILRLGMPATVQLVESK